MPHPGAIRPSIRAIWGARHFAYLKLPGATKRYAARDYAHIRALYRRWSPTWDVLDSELEPVRNSFSAPGSFSAALGYYRQLPLVFMPPMFRKTLRMPCMLVAGTNDPALSVDVYERGRGRRFSGILRVVGLSGGHFVHRESPDAFVTELLDFLGPAS